jgi:putative redox protein
VTDAKPPLVLDLDWQGDLRFRGQSQGASMILDSAGDAGPSPIQALAFALAACMSIDVVHILTKGRREPRALQTHLTARRMDTDPRRLSSVTLRFTVTGDVPEEKVARAIALSREKYCSVWHSLRPDIEFITSFDVVPT